MDIIIKNIDKLKNCGECMECPSRESCSINFLPEGHGRLVDIDAFLKEWKGRYYEGPVEDLINCMKVIVDKDNRVKEKGIAEVS